MYPPHELLLVGTADHLTSPTEPGSLSLCLELYWHQLYWVFCRSSLSQLPLAQTFPCRHHSLEAVLSLRRNESLTREVRMALAALQVSERPGMGVLGATAESRLF